MRCLCGVAADTSKSRAKVKATHSAPMLPQKMAPRLKESLADSIMKKSQGNPPPEVPVPAQ